MRVKQGFVTRSSCDGLLGSQRIPGPRQPWWVLQTKSRQEKALALQMGRLGLWSYLPLVSRVRYYGRRKARVSIPLFPGYLFMRGDIDHAYEADRTGRVSNLIAVPDQDHFEEEIWSIWTVLKAGGAPLESRPIICGVMVEVTSGPFAGVRGVVDEERFPDRLVLRVDLIGGAADLEIDRSLLARVA